MQNNNFSTLSWDLVVFLTITTVGFGLSVQKLNTGPEHDRVLASLLEDPLNYSLSSSNPTWDLGCLERKMRGRPRAISENGAVRIKGRLCRVNRYNFQSLAPVRVRNLTNGYEGTLFFRGYDGSFNTDFVILNAGNNELQIEWKDLKDTLPKTFVADVYQK